MSFNNHLNSPHTIKVYKAVNKFNTLQILKFILYLKPNLISITKVVTVSS